MIGRDLVNDDDIRRALVPYRQVQASERLREAVVRPLRRAPRARSIRGRPRVVAGVVAGAALAAAVAMGVMAATATDDPSPGGVGTETAGRPVDITGARAVVFADGTTVSIEELFDVANHAHLQAVFAAHGAELVIIERPVAPAADGRVFSVMADVAGNEARSHLIHLDAGVRVEVEVGRADPAAESEGLTLYEVFPEVEDAIVRDDPVATGRALEALGFRVRWVLIEAAGQGHDVGEPPADTVVLSVLGPQGQRNDIDPATDTLMVELASPDVAQDLDH